MPQQPLTVLSLFSGAGGLDYGLEAAGFDVRACVDFDPDACRTIQNSREWPVIEDDIEKVPAARLLAVANLAAGEPSLLAAGPPCQPFSKAGLWANGQIGRLTDPRAGTLQTLMKIFEATLPHVLLIENVPGLPADGRGTGLQKILTGISLVNERQGTDYRPSWSIVRSADHGVPQLRQRFLLVADRDGREFKFPAPTHAAGKGTDGRSPFVTAWDAIGDLNFTADESLQLRGKWGGLVPSIPEGSNYLYHTTRGAGLPLFGWRRRYWSFLLKLAKDRPSWTIAAQPGPATGPLHWKNRRLSVPEMARLQTFPDDVRIFGSLSSAQRQIGNAVPSLLAEKIGAAIREQLLDGQRSPNTPTLLPQRRTPVPSPEAPEPVPRRYRKYIGKHAPHPGPGRGPRARVNVT